MENTVRLLLRNVAEAVTIEKKISQEFIPLTDSLSDEGFNYVLLWRIDTMIKDSNFPK